MKTKTRGKPISRLLLSLAISGLLTACGGGSGENDDALPAVGAANFDLVNADLANAEIINNELAFVDTSSAQSAASLAALQAQAPQQASPISVVVPAEPAVTELAAESTSAAEAEPSSASEPVAAAALESTPEPAPAAEPEPTPEPAPAAELEPTPEPAPATEPGAPAAAFGELRIFPGAEGFGTDSVGGRGGEICFVTSLADSGFGTLRDCVERSGPRIVLFKTGGTIEVESAIQIENPYISIYGQSAPGDGILLRSSIASADSPMAIKTHDVLVQHMRFRAGTSHQITCCRDALQIGSETAGDVYNVVVDHSSMSWGTDEILEIWNDAHDVTLSYNIVAESMFDNGSNASGPAGRGILVGSNGAHSISIHHNYVGHSYQRNPLVKTSGIVDVTNNLIFHWISRGGESDTVYAGQQANWVKNKYVALETSNTGTDTAAEWGDILLTRKANHPTEVYFEGNKGHLRSSDSQPEWEIATTDWNQSYDPGLGYHSNLRFPAPPVTEMPADALATALPPQVGAILPRRDSVDTRVIQQYHNREGDMPNCVGIDDRPGDERCQKNVGGWPTMDPGSPFPDQDNDGMPDAWETSVGFNPNVADSLEDANGDGYLNIEDWVHTIQPQ